MGPPRVKSRHRRHTINPNRLLLPALIVVVALFGGASRADAFSQPAVRIGAILIATIALLVRRSGSLRPFRPIALFGLLVAGWIAVQLIPLPPAIWTGLPGRQPYLILPALLDVSQPWRPINITPAMGWNAFMALIPAAAALLVYARSSETGRRLAIPTLLVVMLVSAVLGLAQIAQGDTSTLRFYRVTNTASAVGLFANRNHQALLLALAFPLLCLWAAEQRRSGKSMGALLGTVAALAAFFALSVPIAGSRAGLIWLFLGILALVLILWDAGFDRSFRSLLRGRRRWIAAFAGFLAIPVVGALFFFRSEAFARLFTADIADDPRRHFLGPSLNMLRDFAPVGSGFGSFATIYRSYEHTQDLMYEYVNQAHNDLLQILIEGGLPALLLLLLFAGWWIRRAIETFRRIPGLARSQGQAGLAITGLCLAASLIDYPLRTPLISVIFVLACCWMQEASRGDRSAEEPASA